eukprot:scaffold431_cov334-Pavlova_lutheri.AAC.118
MAVREPARVWELPNPDAGVRRQDNPKKASRDRAWRDGGALQKASVSDAACSSSAAAACEGVPCLSKPAERLTEFRPSRGSTTVRRLNSASCMTKSSMPTRSVPLQTRMR